MSTCRYEVAISQSIKSEKNLTTTDGPVSSLFCESFTSPIGYKNWLNPIQTDNPNTPTGEEATTFCNLVMVTPA